MKKLIDKQLEHQMLSVFQKQDSERKGSLSYHQFEGFMRLNCMDFVLDFYERSQLEAAMFVDGRVTFPELMRFIEEQTTFKHTKQDYK